MWHNESQNGNTIKWRHVIGRKWIGGGMVVSEVLYGQMGRNVCPTLSQDVVEDVHN